MVCYARPASGLAAILIAAALVFGTPVSHFLGTAAVVVVATVAIAAAAAVAVIAFAVYISTRRRRAAAGGCVSCQFRCQHAMTERPGRVWLAATVDRSLPEAAPAPTAAGPAPRWPDRPIHRAGPVPRREPQPAGHLQREPAAQARR
jgi:hypothetical protein